MYVYPRVYQATMCTNKHKPNRRTGLSWILGSLPPPPHGESSCLCAACLPSGSRYPGVCPTLGSLPAPPPQGAGVKIPWPGELAPTLEHLTELNAESFFFLNKNLYSRSMGFLCAYASFTWKEEIEGQNIVALDEFTYARKPGRLHSKRQFIT